MKKPGLGSVLVPLFLLFASCTNPMVNYLLGEESEEPEALEDRSPVALFDNVWYDSLQAAIDAAIDSSAASGIPPAPSTPWEIQLRRTAQTLLSLGAAVITIEADQHIRLVPYTVETTSVAIGRWQGSGALFTVKADASLSIGAAGSWITIDGRRMSSDAPLVMIEDDGSFTMAGGCEVRGGRNSGNGGGVYCDAGGEFIMKNNARVSDTDVYLEDGAMITLSGIVSGNPIAQITPENYIEGTQVLTGITLPFDVTSNNNRFDVTPVGSATWRVDADGKLFIAKAKRVDGAVSYYYKTLQEALDEALYGGLGYFNTIVVLADVNFNNVDSVKVDKNIKITVEDGHTFTLKRSANTSANMFEIKEGGVLDIGAAAGSSLILDGGAVWDSNIPPSEPGANNTGVTSTAALIGALGSSGYNNQLILRSGVIIQNNDRTGPNADGGAIQSGGYFEMNGGIIRNNRTAGYGGAVFFQGYNYPMERKILSGTVENNYADKLGGGIMMDFTGRCTVTMSGGTIRGNKAGGNSPTLIDPACIGYGGGIFIPGEGGLIPNRFTMTGGTIRDNVSNSGTGNGIAMYRRWTPVSQLILDGNARLLNNDVYLFRESASVDDCTIEVRSGYTTTAVTTVTANTAFIYGATPLTNVLGTRVLSGDSGKFTRFTSGVAGHSIRSDGKLYHD